MIETERLTIKPYDLDDLKGLIDLLINPEISKNFMVSKYESYEQMEKCGMPLVCMRMRIRATRMLSC